MGRLGAFCRRRGRGLLLVALLLCVPAGAMVWRLSMETNLVTMFRQEDARVADFRYFSENFGFSDSLVVVVRPHPTDHAAQAGRVEEWLRASPDITWVKRHPLPGKARETVFIAFPREPSMNQPFCLKLIADMRAFMGREGIHADLSGTPTITAESTQSLERDVFRTGSVAVVLIVLLLALAFRDPLFPLVAMVPLGIGILFTLAFAQGVYQRVTFITAALPSSLLGIGIDYALHLRATALEIADGEPADRWQRVYGRVGPPLLIGMLTSAVAFFSLGFARMGALREMGVVGGVGLAVIFVACLLIAPWLFDRRDRVGLRGHPFGTRWLGRMAQGVVARRGWVIGAFVVITIPLAVSALRIRITADPMAYINRDLPSVRLRDELARRIGLVVEPVLLATADVAAEQRVVMKIRDLIGPDQPFSRADGYSLDVLLRLRRPKQHQYLGKDGRLCLILYPNCNPYDGANADKIKAAMRTIMARCGGDIQCLSGAPPVFYRLIDLIREDLVRVALASSAAVFLVLVLLVRRPRYFLSAMVPLLGGVIWMVGVMRFAGEELTALNCIAMPLVVGLGIDYGVHLVHRLHEMSVENAVMVTGRAIIVASATTVAAFLTLCFADNAALRGMGFAAATGIFACLVWSLVFLPALIGKHDLPHEREHPLHHGDEQALRYSARAIRGNVRR